MPALVTPNEYTLDELVARFGGELVGQGSVVIRQVAPLATAQPYHISFISDRKYLHQLKTTNAGAVIVTADTRDAAQIPRIVSGNPYAYFAKVSALFNPPPLIAAGIHPTADIDSSAVIADTAHIAAFVSIGKNVQIGDATVIDAGCVIGEGVVIGVQSRLYPRVVIYHDCIVGSRVILHAGVVIGADGFGLAHENERWIKIPQIGRVLIGDDVEVGANTTIDRGAMGDTIIEEGVKLDNQIQVAHNVRIGAHSALAGCVGIAGSAVIGRHCTVGGAGMILGHLEITDHVNISTGTLITKSIRKPGTYTSATPFEEHSAWLKNASHLRHLDRMAEKIRQLEKKILELEGKPS